MKKILSVTLFTFLSCIIFSSTSFSSHLKDKSKKEKDKYLEIRIVSLPSKFSKIQIAPANKIKNLSKEIVENKNTKKIDKHLNKKSLLSVLYFDGQNIVVDKKSDKIDNQTKLYSFSISKSFVSYILGNAICNGHIKSLDDKISSYVPEVKGTLYESSTFKELINMTAGDTNFASRKAGSPTFVYAGDVAQKKNNS